MMKSAQFVPLPLACALWLLAMIFPHLSLAQQQPALRLWFAAPAVINPAMTGEEKRNSVSMWHRRQWVNGLNGPIASALVGQFSPAPKIGLGFNFTRQSAVALKQSDLRFQFAYPARLTERTSLRAGGALGFVTRRLDLGSADYSNDPAILAAADGVFGVSGALGLALVSGPWQAGVSFPTVISQRSFLADRISGLSYSQWLNQFYSVRYRQTGSSRSVTLEAWAGYTFNRNLSSYGELGANVRYKQLFHLGCSWHQSFGMAGFTGFQFPFGGSLTYSYEPGLLAQYGGSPSHEIQLRMNLVR